MKTSLTNAIQGLGLSEYESRVYLASLPLGPTSVLAITRKTEMHRTTVYAIIDALKQKGLMHEETLGFKTKFAAEDPAQLEALLEKKRADFRAALPELAALYGHQGADGSLVFYEGLNGVKNAYETILEELKAGDEWLAISDTEQWHALDAGYFRSFVERRAKKRLDVRTIFRDTPLARESKQFERNFSMHIKLVPQQQHFTMSMLVTPKHMLLHSLTTPTEAILVRHPSAIAMQRQVFNLLWESLPNTEIQ